MSVIIKSIPIFVRDVSGEIHIIPAEVHDLKIKEPFSLTYLGKKLDADFLKEARAEEGEHSEAN